VALLLDVQVLTWGLCCNAMLLTIVAPGRLLLAQDHQEESSNPDCSHYCGSAFQLGCVQICLSLTSAAML